MVVLQAGGEKGAVNSCLTAVFCMLSLETIFHHFRCVESRNEISALNSHFTLYISDNNWQLMFSFCTSSLLKTLHAWFGNNMFHFWILVYPSLESEEDNPVFKSRSKKRKSSDDTPYSPTGKYWRIRSDTFMFYSLKSHALNMYWT